MQSHTRHSPRIDAIEGAIQRGKREHREQRSKFWKSVAPVLIVGAMLAVAYYLGVLSK